MSKILCMTGKGKMTPKIAVKPYSTTPVSDPFIVFFSILKNIIDHARNLLDLKNYFLDSMHFKPALVVLTLKDWVI